MVEPKTKCEFCKKEFETNAGLEIHMGHNHKCKICKGGFENKLSLETHQQKDHNMKQKIKCEICNKSCRTNLSLQKHIKSKHKTVKCDKCFKAFESKVFLEAHQDIFHMSKVESPEETCEFCEKPFGKVVDYYSHIKANFKRMREM